jgi:hypothetical protein
MRMRRFLAVPGLTVVLGVAHLAAAPGAVAATTFNAACTIQVSPPALRVTTFGDVAVMTQSVAGCAAGRNFDLSVLTEIRYYGGNSIGPVLAVSPGSFSDHGFPASRVEDLWFPRQQPAGFYRGWADVVATFGFVLSRETSPGPGCEYFETNKIYCSAVSEATYLPAFA